MADVIKEVPGGLELRVKVVPGASRDRIAGLLGDALKVQVAAAPERGKANASVTALIARALGLATRDVSVVRGQTSPQKVLLIRGGRKAAVALALGLNYGADESA